MTTNGRYTTNGKHTAPSARNVLGGPHTEAVERKAQSAERTAQRQADSYLRPARAQLFYALRFALQRLREAALEFVRREDLLRHAVDVTGGAL